VLDFRHRHAEQLARHEDILPSGKIWVEAHAQLQQRGHACLPCATAAGGRQGGAGDQLEQGALAGAVNADQADGFARLHREA
jgi:hypothetical protein